MRYIFSALALLILLAAPAAADEYAPGTVGYLYEDCRRAVMADSAAAFQDSYCFHFGIGYAFGALSAQRSLPAPDASDPCHADRLNLHTQREGLLCPIVAYPPPYALQSPVLAALHMFFAWIEEQQDNAADILHRPATTALNAILAPGAFCDRAMAYRGRPFPYDINPAVSRFAGNVLAVRKAVMARTTATTVEQCRADSAAPDRFRTSNCGAEITGYLTGIYAQHIPAAERLAARNESCAPALGRIYQSLDVGQYRCHAPGTEPLLLALAYIRDNHRADGATKTGMTGGKQRFGTISTALPRLRLCAN